MRETLESVLDGLRDSSRREEREKVEDAQFLHTLGDTDRISLPLACAFLLTDMALIDGNFDDNEYAFILNRLQGPLGIPKEEAIRIIEQARSTLATGRGSFAYAEYLKTNYTAEQRTQAYEMLKAIVLADGRQDDFEIYLQNRLAQSLGIG